MPKVHLSERAHLLLALEANLAGNTFSAERDEDGMVDLAPDVIAELEKWQKIYDYPNLSDVVEALVDHPELFKTKAP